MQGRVFPEADQPGEIIKPGHGFSNEYLHFAASSCEAIAGEDKDVDACRQDRSITVKTAVNTLGVCVCVCGWVGVSSLACEL